MMKRVPAMKKGGSVSTVKRIARYVEPHIMQTPRYAAIIEDRMVCQLFWKNGFVGGPYMFSARYNGKVQQVL